MTVLGWVAVLVGAWCLASAVAAVVLGSLIRRAEAGETTRELPTELGPLDTGPMRLWLAGLPETPEPQRPERLTRP